MNSLLDRAQFFIDQSRFDLAEKELRFLLSQDPENGLAHSFLGFVLSEQERHPEAVVEAKMGVQSLPDNPLTYYYLAHVYRNMDYSDKAEKAISEAIRLDPEDADFFAVLSQIKIEKKHWLAALEAAEDGLRLDAEHVACGNLRAMALVQLGERETAGQTIDQQLHREPENAFTHANKGWARLHQNQPKPAMEAFREALRLNPNMEWARVGIVEAMKARNPIYRVMLQYFLYMSRLSGRAQLGILLGAVFLAQFLGPLIYLYLAFAILTWTASSFFNLVLRLDPFGKLVLSDDQIVASNWFGACIVAALVNLISSLSTGGLVPLWTAVGWLAMTIPVSTIFRGETDFARLVLSIYSAALAISLTGEILVDILKPGNELDVSGFFIIGVVLFTWIGNFVLSVEGVSPEFREEKNWFGFAALGCFSTAYLLKFIPSTGLILFFKLVAGILLLCGTVVLGYWGRKQEGQLNRFAGSLALILGTLSLVLVIFGLFMGSF